MQGKFEYLSVEDLGVGAERNLFCALRFFYFLAIDMGLLDSVVFCLSLTVLKY